MISLLYFYIVLNYVFGNITTLEYSLDIILDVAIEREVEGDLLLSDMGQGCPFRAGK